MRAAFVPERRCFFPAVSNSIKIIFFLSYLFFFLRHFFLKNKNSLITKFFYFLLFFIAPEYFLFTKKNFSPCKYTYTAIYPPRSLIFVTLIKKSKFHECILIYCFFFIIGQPYQWAKQIKFHLVFNAIFIDPTIVEVSNA